MWNGLIDSDESNQVLTAWIAKEQLRSLLGVTDVNYLRGRHALAVTDSTLE